MYILKHSNTNLSLSPIVESRESVSLNFSRKLTFAVAVLIRFHVNKEQLQLVAASKLLAN